VGIGFNKMFLSVFSEESLKLDFLFRLWIQSNVTDLLDACIMLASYIAYFIFDRTDGGEMFPRNLSNWHSAGEGISRSLRTKKNSLPCPQNPAIGLYSGPENFSPSSHNLFLYATS
jgi:hypothetical protein